MDSELKDLSSSSPPSEAKDDRPLLTPEPYAAIADGGESLEELEKKCAAYVRSDVYGTMGLGEIPVAEKVLLCAAMATLVPIRVFVGMSVLVVYYLICRVCTLFSAPNRDDGGDDQEDYAHMGGWRRAVIFACGKFCSRVLLFVFGFYWINETNLIPDQSEVRFLFFYS